MEYRAIAKYQSCFSHHLLLLLLLFVVNVMNKGLVAETGATRRGIVTSEIPVARVIGASLMQAFNALEHQFYRCLHTSRTEHLDNLLVYLLYGERLVQGANVISPLALWHAR